MTLLGSCAERALMSTRYVLLTAAATIVLFLCLAERSEAYCNYMDCQIVPPACAGVHCMHVPLTYYYYDPGCPNYCCEQGECDFYDDYPESGAGCVFCSSGDKSLCGYGAAC